MLYFFFFNFKERYSLKKSIGLAYLPIAATALGTGIEIEIRDHKVPAKVIPTPFYKRAETPAKGPRLQADFECGGGKRLRPALALAAWLPALAAARQDPADVLREA